MRWARLWRKICLRARASRAHQHGELSVSALHHLFYLTDAFRLIALQNSLCEVLVVVTMAQCEPTSVEMLKRV